MGADGICGSDMHYWLDGGFGPIRVPEPTILRHEIAGTVANWVRASKVCPSVTATL